MVSIMLSITGDFEASQATQVRHLRWGVFASQRPVSLGGKKDAVAVKSCLRITSSEK